MLDEVSKFFDCIGVVLHSLQRQRAIVMRRSIVAGVCGDIPIKCIQRRSILTGIVIREAAILIVHGDIGVDQFDQRLI